MEEVRHRHGGRARPFPAKVKAFSAPRARGRSVTHHKPQARDRCRVGLLPGRGIRATYKGMRSHPGGIRREASDPRSESRRTTWARPRLNSRSPFLRPDGPGEIHETRAPSCHRRQRARSGCGLIFGPISIRHSAFPVGMGGATLRSGPPWRSLRSWWGVGRRTRQGPER